MITASAATAGPRRHQSAPDSLALLLFFLSGASALIYEVVWGRRLAFIFGGTAFAISTVLAAYMAGLALGSWFFGRRIDRSGHPLVVYAALEAGIAAWALLLPLLFGLLGGMFGAIHRSLHPGPTALALIRFVLSFLVLLVSTILMGGTLPVLARLIVNESRGTGRKTGSLYAVNTVGAVVGTLVGGFALIPGLGLNGATLVAVVFNLLVAALGYGLRGSVRWSPAPASVTSPPAAAARHAVARPAALTRGVLIVYAASGFAALAYEVAWTKVLAGILGTTTYAFSAMLATFLLGLALGAFVMSRLADRVEPARLLAWSQLAIGALALAALPLFGRLPLLYVEVFRRWGSSWPAQTMTRFLLCAITMLPPTILMGGAFPLVARLYADDLRDTGRKIGQLYAANTWGAILGSLTAGFLLIPALGRQGTILAASLLNVAAGVGLAILIRSSMSRGWTIAMAVTGLALVPLGLIGGRAWDRHIQTSGAYVYARDYARTPGDLATALRQDQILYYSEETDALLAVTRRGDVLSVRINGKADAGTGDDMLTQRLLGHLPLLHRPDAGEVLVIGLASGVTLGSTLAYPGVRHVDCVEMIPAMAEVVPLFREQNHDPLGDSRVNLVIGDGRNHLALTDHRYDVIISEPSNPWISGIGSLFTREFFALGRRRLSDGGLFCQWVQTYQMTQADFGSVVRTFRGAFPHVAIWMAWPGDVLLLGSAGPVTLDAARAQALLERPEVSRDLAPLGIESVENLLASFVGSDGPALQLGPDSGPLSTDDNLRLEFSMPRHLFETTPDMMSLGTLGAARESAAGHVALTGLPADRAAAITAAFSQAVEGRRRALAGIERFWAGQGPAALPILEEAWRANENDPLTRLFLARALNQRAREAATIGRAADAVADLKRAASIGFGAEKARALAGLGQELAGAAGGAADTAAAGRAIRDAAAGDAGQDATVRLNAALALEKVGQYQAAEREYRAILAQWPDNATAMITLATLLSRTPDRLAEAVSLGGRAMALDPSPGNGERHGWILALAGRLPEAEAVLRRAADGDPTRFEIRMRLASVLSREGNVDEARSEFERIAREDPNGRVGQLARQALAQGGGR